MIRTNHSLFFFIVNFFFISTATFAQTANFDETWKEFLENDKISNMSELIKPDQRYERPEYAKYLLMNTNSNFCQSKVDNAENLMAEVQELDALVYKSIPGFVIKMDDLASKIEAYHSMDEIWQQFLLTKEVQLEELEAIEATKTICEKRTLAKYSYMTAYAHFCQGNIPKSKDIFENRTLRLTEKTTLRVQDVEGLAEEVAKMKTLYQNMSTLDIAWNTYVETGISPGFAIELPLFSCNPVPNMKELILRGAVDICNLAPTALEQVKQIQAESGVTFPRDVAQKVKDLEAAIGENTTNLADLNEAWEAFIPDNKVKHIGKYAYQYCSKEPLIRAYIMDGFAYTCELAEEMLQKIDSLQRADRTALEKITMIKINELAALNDRYRYNEQEIERVWNKFVAQGDKLSEDYISADYYCDNIHQVKDWTIRGLAGTCEEGTQYLDQIESFQKTFEFKLFQELECRVQNLRVKVWECRYNALLKLARIEAPDAYEGRLQELMEEYGVGEQPEVCSMNK